MSYDHEKTSEQNAADDELETAVLKWAEVYGVVSDDWYMKDWILMGCSQSVSHEGVTSYVEQMTTMSPHAYLGMLEYFATQYRAKITERET